MRESQPMQSALDMIRRAISGQGKIIDDLLDMSRIRTGKLVLNLEAVDMGALACSIIGTADADALSTGLELTCTQSEEPVVVRADAARLEQIIWNLLSNAIKFTPAGGHIEVRVSLDGNFGKLSVHDDGQGIDRPFLTRIFEMFGQAPTRAMTGKGGLGIGLALVRQLVDRHAGRIEVESAGLGQGATFTVWLPRFEYPAIVPLRDSAAAVDGAWRGVRVLIADDAVEAAETFGRLLEMDGAEVTVAADGVQALAMFKEALSVLPEQAPFDIVFADIGMPHMDGYELAQRLRELPFGPEVKLVALTGFTRADDVHRASEVGFDAHLGKPLSIGQLTATMQRLLNRGGEEQA